MIILKLFWSFFIVGLFSFGGGYAAMPFIQEQVVDLNGWLTFNEFVDVVTISQMTPGPIGINAATFVGMKVSGIPGAVMATVGFVTPSCIIVLTLAYLYYKYRELSTVKGILKGLRPAVVAMIAIAGISILQMALLGSKADSWLSIDLTSFDFGRDNICGGAVYEEIQVQSDIRYVGVGFCRVDNILFCKVTRSRNIKIWAYRINLFSGRPIINMEGRVLNQLFRFLPVALPLLFRLPVLLLFIIPLLPIFLLPDLYLLSDSGYFSAAVIAFFAVVFPAGICRCGCWQGSFSHHPFGFCFRPDRPCCLCRLRLIFAGVPVTGSSSDLLPVRLTLPAPFYL